MFKRTWFSSLYSRIVFGFIALLAVLLLAQGVLFLWLTGRFESRPQGQTAQQLADFVARELSDALTAEPALDLDEFIRDELANIRRPFLIVMRDGRRASNRPHQLPRVHGHAASAAAAPAAAGPSRPQTGARPGLTRAVPGPDRGRSGAVPGSDRGLTPV